MCRAYFYGYNGMEKNEASFNNGDGNSYTTEFRQYDPRLGRWLSLDPLASVEPGWSPYRAFFDNPIAYTDPNGLYETKNEAKEARARARRDGFSTGRIRKDKEGYYFKYSKTTGIKGDLTHREFGTAHKRWSISEKSIEPDQSFIPGPVAATVISEATNISTATELATAPKPAPVFLRASMLIAPAFLLSGDTPKTTTVYSTPNISIQIKNDHYQLHIKPEALPKLDPAYKKVVDDVNSYFNRNTGGKTDVYALTAKKTASYYPCKSCITCKGSNVMLRQNEIYKFGISQNANSRYTASQIYKYNMIILAKGIPRDVALGLEKALILDYSLGGFGNQRSNLEDRGIYTTWGKPIGNPYFK